ncbi:hypothetical protein HYALB_00011993 [Hymenoscyphus albidus]|uniref:MYND-type domain-containing protein n=1 Tax=Hymenoscyphus albidus TaxID=595503 RepID=A0A9N9LV18_9HELO|nr:hypothetical protein HYALB_00011993 [Hymenoscyphus albidus]
MAPPYLSKCKNCGRDATMKCAGCTEAPAYSPGDSIDSIYCSRECQKSDWLPHKAHCHALGKRKKLFRTAQLLKTAFLTYREVGYDLHLTKIELKNGVLCLHQKLRASTARAERALFPTHLTTNPEHKEAALAKNSCTTATALLSSLTRNLLEGVTSTIEVLDLQIGKPLIPTRLVPGDGPDCTICPHTILKVRPRGSSETWIIDTAGCQYGFRDVLIPYEKYLTERSCKISGKDPEPYDWTVTKDLDFFDTIPFMNTTHAQKVDRGLEREARLHFAIFVNTHVTKDILNGSAAEFARKLEGFVQGLEVHMKSFSS